MLRLYRPAKAEKIIRCYSPWLDTLAERYGIPAACMKAVLRKEIADIDLFDPLADAMVAFNWLRYDLKTRLFRRQGAAADVPPSGRGVFAKRDSSTGYAQIFAFVALRAVRFAEESGLTLGRAA